MSLFCTRDFWHTQCGVDEEFESSSLLVTRLNAEHDCVLVASHSGHLRIYRPSTDRLDNGSLAGYKATDLVIEIQLPRPVLQMATGRLVSGSQILQLALLHPRDVGVYSLVSKPGLALHGQQNSVLAVYDHALHRSAANFVVGPFGGAQNRDFICVQSLDGMLTFFEQETFAFCCFLPNFLLPGPIVFVKNTDCFVTCSSGWQIENYRYKRLSEIGQNSDPTSADGIKYQPDWSFNVGENVLDLSVISVSAGESVLVVLGERNLFCLGDNGKLRFMKRFDFSPHCSLPYYLEANSKLMTMVVSETGTLLLYENVSLKWSARLSFLPVSVRRASFANIRGSVVLLSEDGALACAYLGTEPFLFSAPPLRNQELNFEKAERELATLNRVIRSSRLNDVTQANATTHRELSVALNVNPHLDATGAEGAMACLVSVELVPNAPFEEVQVALVVARPLRAVPHVFFASKLGREKMKFSGRVFREEAGEEVPVPHLVVRAVVSHITAAGVPRVLVKEATLPLKLALSSRPPQKEAPHKITLNINRPAPPLSTIFPEFVGENSLSLSSNCAGFGSGATPTVTIISAKSSQRYRLQSDSLAAVSCLAHQLVERLGRHFEGVDFSVRHGSSALPTDQLLDVVTEHDVRCRKVNTLQRELNDLATQFRLVQKRLMAKFKDKRPSPLHSLDVLMRDTHAEILDTCDRLTAALDDLTRSRCELSAALGLTCLLLRLSGDVTAEAHRKVRSMFAPVTADLEDQSWEEVTDATVRYLLRTVLAKSEKDRLKNAQSALEPVRDLSKFRKRVSLCLERLVNSGGSALLEDPEDDEAEKNATSQSSQPGSEIAESSVRAQSARPRTAHKIAAADDDDDDVMDNT